MTASPSEFAAEGRNTRLAPYAHGFAFGSAAFVVFSIFVSHLCLVLSSIFLLASRTRPRMPPVVLPLAGFMGFTIISLFAADDPAAGLPQIKKFFVFLTVIVVFSAFRGVDQSRRLAEAWFVLASVAAGVAIVQFGVKWTAARSAGADFYQSYIDRRISGFFSHWMTFSEVAMIVLLVLLSYLLFAATARRAGRLVWILCTLALAISLALSYTRGVWLGILAGITYLTWQRNRKLVLAIPAAALAAALLAPGAAGRRIVSIADPDANSARLIMWRTGWRMIQDRPLLGVGPMRVGAHFPEYLPPDVNELPPAYYEHLHNVYIHYAAERGVPAMLMLVWLLGKVIWDHGRALRHLPRGPGDERFLLHGAIAATIGVLVVSCFDLTLGDSEILGLYLAVVAIGYKAVEAAQRRSAATEPSGKL